MEEKRKVEEKRMYQDDGDETPSEAVRRRRDRDRNECATTAENRLEIELGLLRGRGVLRAAKRENGFSKETRRKSEGRELCRVN